MCSRVIGWNHLPRDRKLRSTVRRREMICRSRDHVLRTVSGVRRWWHSRLRIAPNVGLIAELSTTIPGVGHHRTVELLNVSAVDRYVATTSCNNMPITYSGPKFTVFSGFCASSSYTARSIDICHLNAEISQESTEYRSLS